MTPKYAGVDGTSGEAGSREGIRCHVASFHLQRYCDEQAWRFVNRKTGDGARFDKLLETVVGRRLTYAARETDIAMAGFDPISMGC